MRRLYRSPLGVLWYQLEHDGCSRLVLGACEGLGASDDAVSRWLDAYFSGRPLPPPPLTAPKSAFQGRLRQALWEVPFGETCSYGELAARLGTAPRAVGQALRANPLPLLVPCHRVVAANGPGGFAFGPAWKSRLIAFERSISSGAAVAQRTG